MFTAATQPTQFIIPDSKIHGANMGPTWGRQNPGGPHVAPMNLAIWDGMIQDDRCLVWL